MYDSSKGCYDNSTVKQWIDSYKDGKEYGVRIPYYSYDTTSAGTRLKDAVGMVIEPSHSTVAGQNDWDSTAVGFCVRCNVDMDDPNYYGSFKITSIEGVDNRFDPTQNTFSIRLNGFYKVEKTDDWQDVYISDTCYDGYKPYPLTDVGVPAKEGFHLTACYMDSCGEMDSRSGRAQSTWYQGDDGTGAASSVPHSYNHDHGAGFKNGTYTYMSYADLFEQIVLMQVMLGVKAPKSVVGGNVQGSVSGITLSDVDANDKTKCKCNKELRPGTCLMANSEGSSYNEARSNIVTSCVENDSGTYDVMFKYPNLGTFADNCSSYSYSLVNGYCDDVMGTFGTKTSDGLTNYKETLRFMNVEWNCGLYETVANLIHHGADDTVEYTPINGDAGTVSKTVPMNIRTYIADYDISEEGILVPVAGGASSSTGWRVYGHFNASLDCAWLSGGYSESSSFYGVGYVNAAYFSTSKPYYYLGGRPSTIGGATPEA